MSPRITDFEEDLGTLVIGANSLFGGDHLDESGKRLGILPVWFSGFTPLIYNDEIALLLRNEGGVSSQKLKKPTDRNSIEDYIRGLQAVSKRLKRASNSFDEDRRAYLHDLIGALEQMLGTAMAIVFDKDLPRFEQRYKAATTFQDTIIGKSVTETAGNSLMEALNRAGYSTANGSLRNAFLEWWKKSEYSENFTGNAKQISEGFFAQIKERVLSKLVLPSGINLSDLNLGSYRVGAVSRQPYLALSSYRGGEHDSKPQFEGSLILNTDFYRTIPRLYHLCMHELMHYLEFVISDILWRNGQLGFEATFRTLGTPSAVLMEGMAQNGFELVYGSRNEAIKALARYDKQLAKDLRIHLAHIDLFDIAIHNAALLHQRVRMEIGQLKDYLEQICVLPDELVTMLLNDWAPETAKHPILGIHGATYYRGKICVGEAIGTYEPLNVARVGLHLDGIADIQTFQRKLERLNQ